jgi:hypothetical protein
MRMTPMLRGTIWERFGKELQTPETKLSRTESTGRIFVYAHNPKVVSSNLTPATISKTCLKMGLRDQ